LKNKIIRGIKIENDLNNKKGFDKISPGNNPIKVIKKNKNIISSKCLGGVLLQLL
jgi:hypothetical protein